ncbi:hypothetical protein M885DRAFT_541627 [Pelagophyceae sp. CCMP2097]|nr:hypothetical protein M885DRAFT_541627 [Pelagophyceae sp. CCMP2097]
MRTVFAAASVLAATAAAAGGISDDLAEWGLRAHFEAFEAKFSKVYASVDHRERRFWVFVENLEKAVSDNAALAAQGLDEVWGVTKFSDIPQSEFHAMMGGLKEQKTFAPDHGRVRAPRTDVDVPAAFDWRQHGVVTPVKDQKQCGSCWAHSAVETLESAVALGGAPLTALSVQQVTSCDTTDQGCDGGWYYTAWTDYVAVVGGLATEEAYPYDEETATGTASKCNRELASDLVPRTNLTAYSWATAPCTGFFCRSQDEATLKANLVSFGPASVACDASQWSAYTGGVLTSNSCANSGLKLDHAIQLVGYNETAPVPYWIVRNSWNTDWGNDGYIYLAMGGNTCGVADKAAQVEI